MRTCALGGRHLQLVNGARHWSPRASGWLAHGRVAACRESGQMAVELAVLLPVVLVVLAIAADCLLFVGECARFDHLAAQQTLALAVSPAKDSYGADERKEAVRAALEEEFSARGAQVEVEQSDAGIPLSGAVVYEFRLSTPPWPFHGSGSAALGVHAPELLQHSYRFVFDPYTPGEL